MKVNSAICNHVDEIGGRYASEISQKTDKDKYSMTPLTHSI